MLNVKIPLAVQIVIDDVGWWSGKDGSGYGEPFRTGINRRHVPLDYQAIVDLGRKLNMRPQAAMVMCEWDQNSILSEVPSSTWMGDKWQNSQPQSELDRAAEIINAGSDHFELTMHGIGHEYWENGLMTRAEWVDSNGNMRPIDDVIRHIDYYFQLLHRSGLPVDIHSFVPCAFLYRFESEQNGLGEILSRYGIDYISSPFVCMTFEKPAKNHYFGIDSGCIVVDRGDFGVPWKEIDAQPSGIINGPVCGLHWPNILHIDPDRNNEVVDRWANFFKKYADMPDKMLAPDTGAGFSQCIYHELACVSKTEDSLQIDLSNVKDIHARDLKDSFYIKVEMAENRHIVSDDFIVEFVRKDNASDWRLFRLTPAADVKCGKLNII